MERNDTTTGRTPELEALIGAMKDEDARVRAAAQRAKLMASVAGVFTVGLFLLTWIAPPDNTPGLYRLVLAGFGTLFLATAYVNWRKVRTLAGLDYGQPTGVFLKRAEQRYRLIRWGDVAVGVAITVGSIVGGGAAWLLAKERYAPGVSQGTALLLYALIIGVSVTTAAILGWRHWRRYTQPIVRQLREWRTELERAEANGL